MTNLNRSDIEFAKRVFVDRLTTDQQPLDSPNNIDAGPGDQYVYANVGDAGNFGIGFDCSGLCGVLLGIAIFGPSYFPNNYQRLFSTETFPGPLPGFRQTDLADLQSNPYPLKVMIYHGGGGPNSHMAAIIDGIQMESNGTYGLCSAPDEITPMSYWNDFRVYDGVINEDTTWRVDMAKPYPRGLDYAGGRIRGADLAANRIDFVVRYLTDGGASLPGKLLLPSEFTDLRGNGISVSFVWETDGRSPLNGYRQGIDDATAGMDYIVALPGLPAGWLPVIYSSADFDATPDQQGAINAYCQGMTSVLGTEPSSGKPRAGLYGGYWPISRALDAGVIGYAWQTEAWSGGNIDARVNIVQRNGLGHQVIDGVQCDINEAHTDWYGQVPPVGFFNQ